VATRVHVSKSYGKLASAAPQGQQTILYSRKLINFLPLQLHKKEAYTIICFEKPSFFRFFFEKKLKVKF